MPAILAPISSSKMIETWRVAVHPACNAQEEVLVMSKLTIAFALTLATTAANAQNPNFGQSHASNVASADGMQPFLFDGRMRSDGVRQRARADDRHPDAGIVVVPPEVNQPGR